MQRHDLQKDSQQAASVVTLLIPTMNRSDFLIRLLRYYRDLDFQGYICIGDSSDTSHVERTKEAIKELQGKLNIIYQEYPQLNNAECVARMLNFISTPYAALVPDDDFLVPSALERCVQYLEEHPDASAAHGVGMLINLGSSGPYGRVVSAGYYRQPVVDGKSASQRLISHLSNYSVTLFSVHRIESWRAMYKGISLVVDRDFAQELQPCCISVILGKVKELDCLYLVRQVHDRRYLSPDAFDWVTSPNWLSSYKVFRDCLGEELAQHDGISVDEACELVKQEFWSYLAKGLNGTWEEHYVQRDPGFRSWPRKAARRMPFLRWGWEKVQPFLPGGGKEISLPALLHPSSPYHSDFMQVYRAVTASPPS